MPISTGSGSSSPPALVLFDIDGTLLRRSGPAHREALERAIHLKTGLTATTDGIPLYGMLDPVILAEMMRRAGAGAPAIRIAMPEVIASAQRIYLRTCPSLERKTCPGVRRFLKRLERRGVLMGLVTGNLTRIGWHKMERAGLRPHFRFGAFGEMAADRAGLVRLAVKEARTRGWIGRQTPVSLIGDAPADILAARAAGVRSVAVSTGVVAPDRLRSFGPDVLVEDLRGLDPEILMEMSN
jgi:phosphoglycolate phosphatase